MHTNEMIQKITDLTRQRDALKDALMACMIEMGHTDSVQWGLAYDKGIAAIALAEEDEVFVVKEKPVDPK